MRDYKVIHSPHEAENSFYLKNTKAQVFIEMTRFSDGKINMIYIEITDPFVTEAGRGFFNKSDSFPQVWKKIKNIVNNFHANKNNLAKSTWKKYENAKGEIL